MEGVSRPMRVIVTGSRTVTRAQGAFVRRTLTDNLGLIAVNDGIVLVHGRAKGVDDEAECWSYDWTTDQVRTEKHPADWKTFGRAAGPLRNNRMVGLGAEMCLGFPGERSVGTWDCLRKAVAAGIRTRVYRLPAT